MEDPYSQAHPDDGHDAITMSWIYGLFFGLCLVTLVLMILSFFKFKTYRNESSLTLISLVTLKWCTTTFMWFAPFYKPSFY